jgi:hypothetical protein
MVNDGVRDDHHEGQTITMRAKPTTTPAKMATTTNMTSPQKRGPQTEDYCPSILGCRRCTRLEKQKFPPNR